MILYLVCFDLSQSLEGQVQQISYWLNFLHSSLPLPPPPVPSHANWGILLVGLCADKQDLSAPQVQLHHITTWQGMWPRLSILNKQIFAVSSITSEESVRKLFNTVDKVCGDIFEVNAVEIPSLFRATLESIKSIPPSSELVLTTEAALHAEHASDVDEEIFSTMLQYFHSIGHIVCLRGGLVCTDPQSIPKLAASFISPEEIRMTLLKNKKESVQILTAKDVGYLISMPNSDDERYLLLLSSMTSLNPGF